MAERVAETIVLVEDIKQFNFVYYYLLRNGYDRRTIRVIRTAPGEGSGEQYVREQYATEVQYYRHRSHRRRAALVVVIDADTKTGAERERELKEALENAGQDARKASEAIALLIPRRHIETWILCLLGNRVDESEDCKGRPGSDQVKPAAKKFYEWSRPPYRVPGHCVDSLRQGLDEIRRIP